jgi:hypothetical protein
MSNQIGSWAGSVTTKNQSGRLKNAPQLGRWEKSLRWRCRHGGLLLVKEVGDGVLREIWTLPGCEHLTQHRGVPAAGGLPRCGGWTTCKQVRKEDAGGRRVRRLALRRRAYSGTGALPPRRRGVRLPVTCVAVERGGSTLGTKGLDPRWT